MKTKLSFFILAVSFLLFIVSSFLIFQSRQKREEPIRVTFDFGQPQKNRIAVLFFQNMGGRPEDEYLSDGLTEDVITRLAKIEGLNVKSMTDILRFKNKPVTIYEIGKALNVDAVLEGSVRKMGETILVTAQLIDVVSGLHIWAERYERKIALEDIFGLQNELATKIAEAAHLNLTQGVKQGLTQRPTVSSAAYEFYLKGKYYHIEMTSEGNWMAIEMFQKAIELDPKFALAYAGLADAYATHYHWVDPPDKFWLDQAKEQVQEALEIDPNLAEAHKALAHCYEHLEDFQKSAEEYQKALAVNPNYVDAQIGLAQIYCNLGRYEDALRQLEIAVLAHPQEPYIYYTMGCVYAMKGDKLHALEWLHKAKEHGFHNLELLRKDIFLDSLRKDPKFIKFLRDFEKKKDKSSVRTK